MKIPVITAEVLALTAASDRDAVLGPLDKAIEAALADINGTARQFTITSGAEVRDLCRTVENTMERSGVSKAHRGGTTVTYVPGGPYANAYRSAARSTKISLGRASTGAWYLTKATRVMVSPKQAARLCIAITPTARDEVVRHALADYTVQAENPDVESAAA